MKNINLKNKINKDVFFRFKKINNEKYLITNDIWYYSFLSNNDFKELVSWDLNNISNIQELKEKKFIYNEDEKDKSAIEFANKYKHLGFWPSLHIIVTTLRCNHSCSYCHASVTNEKVNWFDLDKLTALKIIETIFHTSSKTLTIEFQWWEPLLNFDIIKFIIEESEYRWNILTKGVNFSLVTNLSLMDDEKLMYLLQHNVAISTSLDWDEILHNKNRIYSKWNSYELVKTWIKKINDWYLSYNLPFRTWAILTVTKDSLSKWKEIVDTYIDIWLTSIYIRPLNEYGFAENNDSIKYNTYDYLEFYYKIMDYILLLNQKWVKIKESSTMIYLIKILKQIDPNFMDEREPCGASIWQVAYNYNWEVYTCDEWRMLWRTWDYTFKILDLWNIWSENYNNIINSDITKNMVQASTLEWLPWYIDDVYKPYLWVCPIYNYKYDWNLYPNYKNNPRYKLWSWILDYIFNKLLVDEYKEILMSWISK